MFEAVDNAIKTYDLLPPELLELLDNSNTQETLECTKLKIKGKMDYYNPEKGYIIDLKVPGSIDMFTKDLYIGRDRHINTNHRYVRQLAWYSYLVEQAYGMYPQASLLAISHK